MKGVVWQASHVSLSVRDAVSLYSDSNTAFLRQTHMKIEKCSTKINVTDQLGDHMQMSRKKNRENKNVPLIF